MADAEGGRGDEEAVVEDTRVVGAGRVGEHGPEPGGIDDPAGEVAELAADAGELLGEAGRGSGPGLEVVVRSRNDSKRASRRSSSILVENPEAELPNGTVGY